MSERYSKLFTLPASLFAKGAPAIVKAGALLKDNDTNWLLAQLKLQSITKGKNIKLLKVEIICYDSLQRPIGTPVVHEYLDINVSRGEDFGAKSPIKISEPSTRSFTAKIIEVGFDDNSVWTDNGCVWNSIATQEPISSELTGEYEQQGYEYTFGKMAQYKAIKQDGYWLCTCGEINLDSEERCCKCNSSISALALLDKSAIRTVGIYQSACELSKKNGEASLKSAIELFDKIPDYEDSQQLKAQCQEKLDNIAKKKAKKKKRRFLKLGISLAVLLVIWFAIIPSILILNGNYNTYINLYNVKKFKIPAGVTEIGEHAFDRCGIEELIIPEGVETIGNFAIQYCYNLKSVTLPQSLKSIGTGAFQGCDSLENIEIPDGVETIKGYAFAGCPLKSVIIPQSVKTVGSYAFAGCDIERVEIPKGIKTIKSGTFSSCYKLKEVVIPDSVTVIETEAFSYCTSLEQIKLPSKLTEIGDSAFSSCEALKNITLPSKLTKIGSSSFESCKALKSITLPRSVKTVGWYAFRECKNLKEVYIPKETKVGDSAFYFASSSCTIYCEAASKNSVGSSWDYGFGGDIVYNYDFSKVYSN